MITVFTTTVKMFVAAAIIVALALEINDSAPDDGPSCYEDEVAMWDGEAHTICVPLDDLTGRGD